MEKGEKKKGLDWVEKEDCVTQETQIGGADGAP